MGVEPHHARRIGAQSGQSSDGGVAISCEHDRQPIGFTGLAYRDGEHSHQLEPGLDLRVPGIPGQLRNFDVHLVARGAECFLQPAFEQRFRSRTHSSASVAGIVGDGEQLDVQRGRGNC